MQGVRKAGGGLQKGMGEGLGAGGWGEGPHEEDSSLSTEQPWCPASPVAPVEQTLACLGCHGDETRQVVREVLCSGCRKQSRPPPHRWHLAETGGSHSLALFPAPLLERVLRSYRCTCKVKGTRVCPQGDCSVPGLAFPAPLDGEGVTPARTSQAQPRKDRERWAYCSSTLVFQVCVAYSGCQTLQILTNPVAFPHINQHVLLVVTYSVHHSPEAEEGETGPPCPQASPRGRGTEDLAPGALQGRQCRSRACCTGNSTTCLVRPLTPAPSSLPPPSWIGHGLCHRAPPSSPDLRALWGGTT